MDKVIELETGKCHILFNEIKKDEDTKFPMWYKDNQIKVQLELFDVNDFD